MCAGAAHGVVAAVGRHYPRRDLTRACRSDGGSHIDRLGNSSNATGNGAVQSDGSVVGSSDGSRLSSSAFEKGQRWSTLTAGVAVNVK